ncbi:synergin gamma-like isoform X2 [Dendropsophus ebraccatus]|uniref:synergin gamma-like isoform X2 n=1 Tax=Dendropsophus ebraccatus TaxID=150705 RepID=UPI0038320616
MAIEPSLLDTCTAHLKTALKHIHKVIQTANEILSSISQPSVCSEVLLSSQGADYITGVVEVYRLSKRMEGGIRRRNMDCERLRLVLRDIELSWNNLQAFLSICPSLLQTLFGSEGISMLDIEGRVYHPSCANFWLHCVDSSLPALTSHNYCPHCLILDEL